MRTLFVKRRQDGATGPLTLADHAAVRQPSFLHQGAGMTTIAWDGVMLAADRRITSGTVAYSTTKIRRTADGRLIGATGDFGVCGQMLDWLEHGGARPGCQESERWATALEVMPDGACWMHNRDSRWRVEDAFVAVGSGRDYAMAVMALGHDATRAVEIASRFDPGTGTAWTGCGS